jgi:hypothetical protein
VGAAKTNLTIYVTAEKDFELKIFQKNLLSITTKQNKKMKHVKQISIPYTMKLSKFEKKEKAVLIETTLETSVIVIDNHEVYSDSTMILPIKHLSDTYIISTVEYSNQTYKAVQFAIAALENSTIIRIIFRFEPNLPLTVDGIEYQNGSEMLLQLNELQTYQINHKVDLSGTLVHSSSTVAVFSGNRCHRIPIKNNRDSRYCSHLVEQLPPVNRLDNLYIVPPNINRYGTILKIVSPFKNRVTYTVGSRKTTVSLLPQGYYEFSVSEYEVAVIESERPVLVTSFAVGSDTSGNPYMIIIPGVHQYLNKYRVFAPRKFADSYIALVIEETSLPHLTINNKHNLDNKRTFYGLITVGEVRYQVMVVHVARGAFTVKTTDNAFFGLLVYGHGKNGGHGYAGNVVLPDICVS